MSGCGPVGPARIDVVGPTGVDVTPGSGLGGRAVSAARRHAGEAGQIRFRLTTIRSGCRCGSSMTTGFVPSGGRRDSINSCRRSGASSARCDGNQDSHQRAQHRPANVGLSGAEGAIRALRALRLCRSSRPRLERGGRRTTASHQSRCRKLLAASDGSSRKPQLTRATRGLLSGPRRASAWRTAM